MKTKFFFLTFCCFAVLHVFGQTSLIVADTRNDPTTPSSYNRTFQPHFKYGHAIGLPEVGNPYYFLLGFRAWYHDNSGGKAHELAFSNNYKIFFRSGNSPNWQPWRELIIADTNGNVGIGTDNPQAKLAINGNVLATEVKVKTDISVPDYVFEADYELPALAHVEAYVKEHKHLPEIPSAADIQRDGLDLAKMNLLLLKKVEELTLYLIEKDNENSQLRERLTNIEQRMGQRSINQIDLKP